MAQRKLDAKAVAAEARRQVAAQTLSEQESKIRELRTKHYFDIKEGGRRVVCPDSLYIGESTATYDAWVPNGLGCLVQNGLEVFNGSLSRHGIKEGPGTAFFSGGGSYSGAFKRGIMHGKGKLLAEVTVGDVGPEEVLMWRGCIMCRQSDLKEGLAVRVFSSVDVSGYTMSLVRLVRGWRYVVHLWAEVACRHREVYLTRRQSFIRRGA
jgi:hypothetical protein